MHSSKQIKSISFEDLDESNSSNSPNSYDTKDLSHALEDTTLKKTRILTWDEQGIAEDDRLRGTRMKIEEPKTPFSRSCDFEEQDMPMISLSDAAVDRLLHPIDPSVSYESSDEGNEVDEVIEQDTDGEEKKRIFELARKQHYQLKRHSIHSIDEDDMEQDKMDVVG